MFRDLAIPGTSVWAEGPSRAMAKVVAALTGLEVETVLPRTREHVRQEVVWHFVPPMVLAVFMAFITVIGGVWINAKFDVFNSKATETYHAQQKIISTVEWLAISIEREKGIPYPAVLSMLSNRGDARARNDPEGTQRELRTLADIYLGLRDRLKRLSSLDPIVQRLLREADIALSEGRFDDAARSLDEAVHHKSVEQRFESPSPLVPGIASTRNR